MADRRREGVLAAALALVSVLVIALIAPPAPGGATGDPRLSTFRSTPHGARALALTLEALDIPTETRRSPYIDSLSAPLALLAPVDPPTPAELALLGRWLERGGTLLYVARPRDPTLDSLGLVLRRFARDSTVDATPLAHRWTEGSSTVRGVGMVFDRHSPALRHGARPLLFTVEGDVAALTFAYGRGTVVAWSDRALFENRALRESGAALLFARAAAEATANGAPLQFDEYHQGYRGDGSPLRAAFALLEGEGRGALVIQLAAAGALLLLGAAWRFGAAIPPRPPRRRSPLEHVDALASLYRQARARATARRLLVAALARRLGRRPPADTDAEQRLLSTLAAHPRASPESARALAAIGARGEVGDLTALCQTIDRVLDEVTRT